MNVAVFGRRVGRNKEDAVRGGVKASAASVGLLLKNLCPEAFNDCRGVPNQQDERGTCVRW